MPAIRALLVALDEWVVEGREPPASRLPRIADGTLVRGGRGGLAEDRQLVPPALRTMWRRRMTGPIRRRH